MKANKNTCWDTLTASVKTWKKLSSEAFLRLYEQNNFMTKKKPTPNPQEDR